MQSAGMSATDTTRASKAKAVMKGLGSVMAGLKPKQIQIEIDDESDDEVSLRALVARSSGEKSPKKRRLQSQISDTLAEVPETMAEVSDTMADDDSSPPVSQDPYAIGGHGQPSEDSGLTPPGTPATLPSMDDAHSKALEDPASGRTSDASAPQAPQVPQALGGGADVGADGGANGMGAEGLVATDRDVTHDANAISQMSTAEYLEFAKSLVVNPNDISQFEGLKKQCEAVESEAARRKQNAYDELKKLAETGKHKAKDNAYQRFMREANEEESKDYRKLKSNKDREAFRDKWIMKRYTSVLNEKEHDESYSHVDTTLGKMLTFGACVQDLGGWEWQPAIDGTKRLFAKCFRLGGKWHDVCEFTELTRCLVLAKEYRDVFTNKWALYEKQFEEDNGEGEPASKRAKLAEVRSMKSQTAGPAEQAEAAEGGSGTPTPKAKAKTKAKAKGKAAGSADGADGAADGGGPQPKPAQTPEKQKLAKLLKDGNALKAELIRLRGSVSSIVTKIKGGGEEYAWANNAENVGKLEKLMCECDESISTFGQEFVLNSTATIKKRYVDARISSEMTKFLGCRGQLQSVSNFYEKIVKSTVAMADNS